ncbi:hypothetical protein ACLOJK_015549 [Asimina triloba]
MFPVHYTDRILKWLENGKTTSRSAVINCGNRSRAGQESFFSIETLEIIGLYYFNFLCAIGYNHTQIANFANQAYKCDPNASLLNFNYPSITIPDLGGIRQPVTISRRMKNVGNPSTYTAKVIVSPGIDVSVQPMSLKFEEMNEEKTFEASLKAKGGRMAGEYAFGKLTWSDGIHYLTISEWFFPGLKRYLLTTPTT